MKVRVRRIQVPALSTIGYGYGTDVETGEEIRFCGDHRPMRDLGEAMHGAEEPPLAEIESWQVLERMS